ncbi:hypothetical protein JVT61DRAFT_10670 [Boletus reticuloceps]|uniref:Uncharacterized protein n=1 Tax=Boletus reticuloceps TaxID=495285 RepID=A0A8I3A422_9AGAM|nr:hypothetical protein JVT61DRAFT_10670 [Boletus reticuloceps]
MVYGSSSRHRVDPPASSVAVPQVRTVIEYRKDGAISKMRSHKGNIPVLPQTKLCPHCPAKFTRTTHLNRHMRTHTGDRSHRCDTCDAQFTRSDLLTRHKKTCGDSSHANRTRRRSCQACADSKVKCDLQRPCSKCQARGKECLFVIRPSRPSGQSVVPTLSTTTVERSSDSEDRAPVLIPATPHPVTSPSPKPYNPADQLPIDQQTEGDCHWATAPSGASSDAVSTSSPSERFCSGSASDSGSPGSVPSQSSFSTLFSGDLLDPFFVYSNYSNTPVSSDHSHSPSDPVVLSPISAVDDPTSFTTQGADVQHPFHASGGSVYYAPSSAQQVQDVITKEHVHLQRQRYAQDHFMPSFSGQVPNFKQNLTEEQHYVFDSSPSQGRSRVRTAGPYQMYGSARRALREGTFGSQLQCTYVDTLDGDYYGRNGDKSTSQPRISSSVTPGHHWPAVPLENDLFDALPRFGSDDQRYRATFAECAVDALQWPGNGAHMARRQVIDPA